MTIELRTYEEGSQQLSQFIVSTWRQSYQGIMSFPDWSANYFDWQMTGEQHSDREYLVTAWKGSNLVGTILGMEFPLWLNGEEVLGAQGSWLAVDPEVRREGVASKLAKELNRRHQARSCVGRLGYAFQGSMKSEGPKFWKPKRTQNINIVRKVHLWVRVINRNPVRQWTNRRLEKIMLGLLPSPVYSIPSSRHSSSIREYQLEDLSSCQELINSQAKKADLAILWNEDRLKNQLDYAGISETLVFEKEGKVIGFLNYHYLDLILNGKVKSAVVDLFANENLSASESTSLLNYALEKIKANGGDIVLMREFASAPKRALLKARFVPQFSDSTLMFHRPEPTSNELFECPPRIQVLWR